MTEKRMLLRDLLARLAQATENEIYVMVDELEPDVFVLPLSFVYSGIEESFLPAAVRMLQHGPVLEAQEADGTVGTGAVVLGAANEIWQLTSVVISNGTAGVLVYTVFDDGAAVSRALSVAAGATAEILQKNVTVAGLSALSVDHGTAADTWNFRAVRIL